MEFVLLNREGGLGSLRGLRIQIHHQNLGDTIFAGTRPYF